MKFVVIVISIIALIFASVQAADQSVCNYPKDNGPCRAVFKRFYFNPESNNCEEFKFGGCLGNSNRFTTMEDCEKLCKPTITNNLSN